MLRSYNPTVAVTTLVWACPRSLATTWGIIVIFFSSGYLDVSVPRVCPCSSKKSRPWFFKPVGCPIRKCQDHFVCADPPALSQLITSFIASESLGIPRVPFFTSMSLEINSRGLGWIYTRYINSSSYSFHYVKEHLILVRINAVVGQQRRYY